MAGTPELPELFTPKQVADRLGCSERTLREALRKHRCFRKIGRKMFLTAGDLDSLLEALKPQPKAPYPQPSRKPRVKLNTPMKAQSTKSVQQVRPPVSPIKFHRTKDDPI